jgi:integrase
VGRRCRFGHRTIRINKAWKRNGEDDATDTPGWLAKQLKPKHTMRDHHLGNPKTPTQVWRKLMQALAAEGIAPFRFHDLRHTHIAWLVAGGAPLPHIQARLGHESITTTIDTIGHLLPAGDELISGISTLRCLAGRSGQSQWLMCCLLRLCATH